MKWTRAAIRNQREFLEPEPGQSWGTNYTLGSFEDENGICGAFVRYKPGRGYRYSDLTQGDRLLDLFMTSKRFDRDLFIMLTSIIGIDARIALEICLS